MSLPFPFSSQKTGSLDPDTLDPIASLEEVLAFKTIIGLVSDVTPLPLYLLV